MIQALLWDMDGVLVDTTEQHYLSWLGALEEHQRSLTRSEFLATFGKNNRATLQQLFGPLPESLSESISRRKEDIFRQNLHRVELYPGVLDWLNYARQHSIPCAVASSAPPENITAIMQQFALDKYFSVLVSASNLPSKPDPAVFLTAATRLEVEPADCLVIEDAPAGAQAALSAGMACLVVLTTRRRSEFPTVQFYLDRLSDGSPPQVIKKISQAD